MLTKEVISFMRLPPHSNGHSTYSQITQILPFSKAIEFASTIACFGFVRCASSNLSECMGIGRSLLEIVQMSRLPWLRRVRIQGSGLSELNGQSARDLNQTLDIHIG